MRALQVGVVGRTGAGKSSLIGALFRLTEICGGVITVGDLDTRSLGLRSLRGAMALIPQVLAGVNCVAAVSCCSRLPRKAR